MENKMIALGMVLRYGRFDECLIDAESYRMSNIVRYWKCVTKFQKKNHKSFHMCGATYIQLPLFSCLYLLAGIHRLVGALDQIDLQTFPFPLHPNARNAVHGSRLIGLQKIQILITRIRTLENQITTNSQAKDDEECYFYNYLLAKHCRNVK